MSDQTQVKICGLRTLADVKAAADAGARYVGFVFFVKSPRNLSFDQARDLALAVPDGICKVALTVNADDDLLDQLLKTVPIDMLQLHGSEPPERVTQLRRRYGLPIMKAVGVAGPEDLVKLDSYIPVADQILVDAKPPKGADLPGGNGLAFDWALIADRNWTTPWMLAGGLTPDNVAHAVRLTGARQVDVSSGVESAPGTKDADKIKAFLKSAQADDKQIENTTS